MIESKPLTLAVAISSVLATQVQAGAFYAEAVRELDAIEWNTANPFIDDASFNLKIRTVGYDRRSYRSKDYSSQGKVMYTTGKKRDVALALWADFESGLLWDTFGIDLGMYGARKLEHVGNPMVPNLWSSPDMDGIGKLGVANLHFELGDETAGVKGRIGRMMVDSPMVKSKNDYAVPDTYEGFRLDAHSTWVSGYGAEYDKHSFYRSSGMDRVGVDTGRGFKSIPLQMAGVTLGNNTRTPTFSVHYAGQDDYLTKTMYQVQMGMPVGDNFFLLDAHYHQQKGGKHYAGKEDHKANMLAINLFGMIGNFEGFVAYSQVGKHAYDLWFTNDMFGFSNLTTHIWNDFTHGKMKAVSAGGYYNLADHGLENFTLLSQFAYGWNGTVMDTNGVPMHGGMMPLTRSNAWEGVAGVTYEVFSGPMQGLWLNVVYNRDGGGYYNHTGGRIMLDYTINLF